MDKKRNRLFRFALAFGCSSVLACGLLFSSCATPTIEVGNPDFTKLRDGSVSGSYVGEMGKAAVTLTVAGGKVTAVRLDSFESSPVGAPAKAILDRVVAKQGLAVDTVSGATYSSKVILRAIQDAVEKGT
jgi:uncharacterized protein with FMN-binding domain